MCGTKSVRAYISGWPVLLPHRISQPCLSPLVGNGNLNKKASLLWTTSSLFQSLFFDLTNPVTRFFPSFLGYPSAKYFAAFRLLADDNDPAGSQQHQHVSNGPLRSGALLGRRPRRHCQPAQYGNGNGQRCQRRTTSRRHHTDCRPGHCRPGETPSRPVWHRVRNDVRQKRVLLQRRVCFLVIDMRLLQ